MEEKVHKYRMDFYYQSLVIYLIFFAAYVLIKGSLSESFKVLYNDPIFYILIIFIALFLVIVILNIVRSPMIILKSDRIELRNRFGSREVLYDDILSVKIGKRRHADEDTTYRIIKLKLKHRKRMLRIRANDFERGSELIREFLKIKKI
ncbi:MAG TPA: hypothetical protein VJ455_06390 [Ignavibacteria bacterium]|nr:hypothetical protein [Ignavibacteria bacterium]